MMAVFLGLIFVVILKFLEGLTRDPSKLDSHPAQLGSPQLIINSVEMERLEYACELVMPHVHKHPGESCKFLVWLFADPENGLMHQVEEPTRTNFCAVAEFHQECLDNGYPDDLAGYYKMKHQQVPDGIGMAGWWAALGEPAVAAAAAANLAFDLAQDSGTTYDESMGAKYKARQHQL